MPRRRQAGSTSSQCTTGTVPRRAFAQGERDGTDDSRGSCGESSATATQDRSARHHGLLDHFGLEIGVRPRPDARHVGRPSPGREVRARPAHHRGTLMLRTCNSGTSAATGGPVKLFAKMEN